MKVIKPPTKVITKEETCKSCGAVLELNPWDYKKKTIESQDLFTDEWHWEKRKWYVCPCCHSVNLVQTLFDGRELKDTYEGSM